jgi:integrase
MTRMRLAYVQAWVDRDGRPHHYFRRPGFPRTKLPGLPGSAEFMRAYQTALASPAAPIGARRTKPGSLDDALVRYYKSTDFTEDLKPATQAMRRAIFERWRSQDGAMPIASLPPQYIAHLLSTLKPNAARSWLKSIRHLMQFCLKERLCRSDPTLGVKLKPIKSDGHHTWSEPEVAQYEAFYPIGSKARLALALAIYTTQRRGDVILMGRQHIRKMINPDTGKLIDVITIKQQKTGSEVSVPIHPHLQEVLDATPSAHLTFLITKNGKPYAPSDFSEQFRAWCDAAGLPQHCVFHGLRKAGLTRLADAGCNVHGLAAIGGHKTLREVERYTKRFDRQRAARVAMAQMVNNSVSAHPAPTVKAVE